MIQISILEDNDKVLSTDYCRPLQLEHSMDGDVRTKSTYSGSPINNLKWINVDKVFGSCWFNKKVKDILSRSTTPYEFARGSFPTQHILKDDL